MRRIPKVSEGYAEQKRHHILDAAQAVSRSKPLHKITMKDIVRASGLSQGGVYLYFSQIEEVWLALATRFDAEIDFQERFEQLRQADPEPSEGMREIFRFIAEELNRSLESGYSKLAFEFNAIYASQAAWFIEQIESQQEVSPSYGYNYMLGQMLTMWQDWQKAGQLQPLRPLEEIWMLVQVTLAGMIREATMEQYLNEAQVEIPSELEIGRHIEPLLEGLHLSVMTLLGATSTNKPRNEG
ncbi:TetR/AcrR family transcriptional regulator [Paenibacillus daejeonensis]|uniref:TetR/AcrR family transcriptional regulator n=1 Tax=Paenibacillus daejeonensis TaxID=135193 RepID=UPI00146F115B|nr:TetR/AcrR family transcriptional regulator [Paenibacillus daejeonensis]